MKRLFQQIMALLLLAAVPAVGTALVHPKKPQWDRSILAEGEVDLRTVLEWNRAGEPTPPTGLIQGQPGKSKVLWVDARPKDQFASGHIPGALLLNADNWEQLLDPFLDEWNRDRIVVVYCGGVECDLSRQVATRLRNEVQIPSVYVLKGGWQAWRESGN